VTGTVIHILALLTLFGVCGLALVSLLFGFPGTWLILVAAGVYAWGTGFQSVAWGTLAWLAVLAAVAEGLEFAVAAAGAAGATPRRGVTAAALIGSFVGGLAGAPFLFGLGALLGALAGAFLGALLVVAGHGASPAAALRAGVAALRGRLLGFVVKAACGVTMCVLLAAAVLWP
jgi:hypothetical protein